MWQEYILPSMYLLVNYLLKHLLLIHKKKLPYMFNVEKIQMRCWLNTQTPQSLLQQSRAQNN